MCTFQFTPVKRNLLAMKIICIRKISAKISVQVICICMPFPFTAIVFKHKTFQAILQIPTCECEFTPAHINHCATNLPSRLKTILSL